MPLQQARPLCLVALTAFVGVLGAGPAFGQDSDLDGVPDSTDAFPCDPRASAAAFAPAEGQFGLLLFEDEWPRHGDLDFNDAVVAYHYTLRLDAAGQAVGLHATFDALALGGDFSFGLGLGLPVARTTVTSIARRIGGGSVEHLFVERDANLTLRVLDNLRTLFGGTQGPINSRGDLARLEGDRIELEIGFNTPVTLSTADAPFDLFIFRSEAPGHEIHLPSYSGTMAMNTALFNTEDDASTASRSFVDGSGLPFALLLPASTPHPREHSHIAQLFPRIVDFASSGGLTGRDFYERDVQPDIAFRDVLGRPAPAPRLGQNGAALARHCSSGLPGSFSFVQQEEIRLGTAVLSAPIVLSGFEGELVASVSGPAGAAVMVNGELAGQRGGRGGLTPIVANTGPFGVSCERTNVPIGPALSVRAGDVVRVCVPPASTFDTLSEVTLHVGPISGVFAMRTVADRSEFYVSQLGGGDCSATSPCTLQEAYAHGGFDAGDEIFVTEDLDHPAAYLTTSIPHRLTSSGPRRTIRAGSLRPNGGATTSGHPLVVENLEIETLNDQFSPGGYDVVVRDVVLRGRGAFFVTYSTPTMGTVRVERLVAHPGTAVGFQGGDVAITDSQFFGAGLYGSTARLTLERNSFLQVSTLPSANHGYTVFVQFSTNEGRALLADNYIDDLTTARGFRLHLWWGNLNATWLNNTYAGSTEWGMGTGTHAPIPSGQTQRVCAVASGNDVGQGYLYFVASSDDPSLSVIQLEGLEDVGARNTYGTLIASRTVSVPEGTCQ